MTDDQKQYHNQREQPELPMMCPESDISRTVTALYWAASHMGIAKEWAWRWDLSEYLIYLTMINDFLKQH